MTTTTYGTTALPSTVITTAEQSTTAVSLAFDRSVGIIGGYDAANASIDATDENTNIVINGVEDAADKFGEGSELHTQVRAAYLNGAGRIVCTPVGETSQTESFASSSSISLGNKAIDPRFNPEEEITAVDTTSSTDITVNYVDGTPETPSTSDTLNINPLTGEGEFSTSSDYDVSYTEGSYSLAAEEAAKADVRFSALCHTDESALTTHKDGVKSRAQQVDFKRAVGAVPTAVEPANYTVPFDEQRIVLGAPTYGTFDGQKAFLNDSETLEMA